jgi:uncharacterized protein (TIGR03118 family)
MSYSPTGPFWFGDAGSGVSNLLDGCGQMVPLVVAVPGAGQGPGVPTGTVFNGSAGFVISESGVSGPARFLFAGADGTISGWTYGVDLTHALLAVDNSSSGAAYTGLALGSDPAGHSYLYAADFGRGAIDVFDEGFRPVATAGAFRDPDLPGEFAPFNVQNIDNLLFVTYARRANFVAAGGADDGKGVIDVFATDGTLVRRFATGGALDDPWGLAVAPTSFGPFGGALLVGNNGDGRISAYDRTSGSFLGQLADDGVSTIVLPGLWGLTFGNGYAGGNSETLFFAAGLEGERHGLFGAIQAPQRTGADTAGPGAFDPNGPGEPGDYPLPPFGGPAPRAGAEEQVKTVAVLLPLTDSSLALAPTLTTVSQTETVAASTPVVAAFANGSAVTTPTVGTGLRTVTDSSQSAEVARNNVFDLNAFLDVNAPQDRVESNAGTPITDNRPAVVAIDDAPTQGRSERAEVSVADEASAQEIPTEALAQAPPADSSDVNEQSEGRTTLESGVTTRVAKGLPVVGVIAVWAGLHGCWSGWRPWSGERGRKKSPVA